MKIVNEQDIDNILKSMQMSIEHYRERYKKCIELSESCREKDFWKEKSEFWKEQLESMEATYNRLNAD